MIVHIGFPKCGSTSLQRIFKSVDARFVGCDPKEKPGAFYTPELGFFFESIFRFGTDKQFQEKAGEIRAYFENLEDTENGRAILSNENMAFRLTPWDLPTDIKMQRLGALLPARSKIIVIFRPVRDFIISLYKNHLIFGYTHSFETFLEEITLLKDYGLLADLILETLCQNIAQHFDDPEIVLLNLETPNRFEQLLDHLDLKLSDPEAIQEIGNPGPSSEDTAFMLDHNQFRPNRKRFLDWLENHRVFPQGSMDDADLFWMSRNRISQRDYIEKTETTPSHIFDPDTIDWPNVFSEVEKKNQDFLRNLGHQNKITLISSD